MSSTRPILEPLVRGGMALAGLIATVAGAAITVPRIVHDGLHPIDAFGLAALAAGLAALSLTARAVWRTVRGWKARAAMVLGVLVGLYVVVFPVAFGVYLTHPHGSSVGPRPAWPGITDATLRTEDGVELAAWYVPSRNGAAVALLHGSGSTRSNTVPHARMLLDHGYGVLLVDGRGAGRSEGRPMALGWTDESDVAAAVSFLADRADVDPLRIGLLGLSLGAEQAITEAASDARVRAVVAEGAGIHSFGDTYSLSGGAEKVVAVVQTWFSMRTVETLSGLTPPPPIEQSIGHVAPRPVLLISGSDRQEQQLNRAYDDAGGATTELWEVPDAPHTHALHTHPSEYERRVVGFFAAALGA